MNHEIAWHELRTQLIWEIAELEGLDSLAPGEAAWLACDISTLDMMKVLEAEVDAQGAA